MPRQSSRQSITLMSSTPAFTGRTMRLFMSITKSLDGVPIRLSAERWQHICRRHPELRGQEKKVRETIRAPRELLDGDFGVTLATRFYRRTPLTSKFLVVAYKQLSATDGFVVTAYFARRLPSWRRRIWTQ